MPIPLALLGAGVSAGGGLLNSASQAQQNRDSQIFSRGMYEKQRRDAIEFWNMQNEYNSPQAQMKRFQDAGLNKNLVYSQGNPGNSSPISTPDVQSPQFRSPEWGGALQMGGLTYLNNIYDLDIKQAQAENLRAQNTVIKQDALLKVAQTASTVTGEEKSRFDLDFNRDLREVSAEARRESLRQLKTSIDLSINEDARRAASNSTSIMEANERMKSMVLSRAQTRAEITRIHELTNSARFDNILKDLDIGLRKQGIMPQDPMWARMVGRVLNDLYEGRSNLLKTLEHLPPEIKGFPGHKQ